MNCTGEELDKISDIAKRAVEAPDQYRDDIKWLLSILARGGRRRLPDTRESFTHKFTITSIDGPRDFFLTVGLYDDGSPGEIFFKFGLKAPDNKMTDSVPSDLLDVSIHMDQWALCFSMLLQYGVPILSLCEKFIGVCCEPSGAVRQSDGRFDISFCSSPFDYVGKYLRFRFEESDGLQQGDGGELDQTGGPGEG